MGKDEKRQRLGGKERKLGKVAVHSGSTPVHNSKKVAGTPVSH